MFIRLTDADFNKALIEYKRFILMVYFDEQQDEEYWVKIKPTWSEESDRLLEAFDEVFPDVVFAESKLSEIRETLHGFNISLDDLWDEQSKNYRPIIISIDKGWISSTSYGKCYCSETLTEMIFDIYPELIPKQ